MFLWPAWGVYRLRLGVVGHRDRLDAVGREHDLDVHQPRLPASSTGRPATRRSDIDMMMRYSGQFEDSTVWMIALWSVGLIGYLLYVRKYFVAGPPPEPGPESAGDGTGGDADERGNASRAVAGFVQSRFRSPMQYRFLCVRMKICPSETAGEARVVSPSSLRCSTSSFAGEARKTTVSPDWSVT